MKSPVKYIILYTIILILIFTSSELIAASSQPPDPGGDPTGGGPPIGGGAPVGNGSLILISMGIMYLSYKTYQIRKSFQKLED